MSLASFPIVSSESFIHMSQGQKVIKLVIFLVGLDIWYRVIKDSHVSTGSGSIFTGSKGRDPSGHAQFSSGCAVATWHLVPILGNTSVLGTLGILALLLRDFMDLYFSFPPVAVAVAVLLFLRHSKHALNWDDLSLTLALPGMLFHQLLSAHFLTCT